MFLRMILGVSECEMRSKTERYNKVRKTPRMVALASVLAFLNDTEVRVFELHYMQNETVDRTYALMGGKVSRVKVIEIICRLRGIADGIIFERVGLTRIKCDGKVPVRNSAD